MDKTEAKTSKRSYGAPCMETWPFRNFMYQVYQDCVTPLPGFFSFQFSVAVVAVIAGG